VDFDWLGGQRKQVDLRILIDTTSTRNLLALSKDPKMKRRLNVLRLRLTLGVCGERGESIVNQPSVSQKNIT
jgi:hypothetical protein